jgi:hypothetical protein
MPPESLPDRAADEHEDRFRTNSELLEMRRGRGHDWSESHPVFLRWRLNHLASPSSSISLAASALKMTTLSMSSASNRQLFKLQNALAIR